MDKQEMRNRRIAALIFLIVGLTFSGMALFADSLGLDDHSGWGRLRTMFFVANILLTLLAALYLLFQKRADRLAIQLSSGIGRNPFISRLLNSAAVVRLSSALQKYS